MKAMNRSGAVFLPPENDGVQHAPTQRRLSVSSTVVVQARASIIPVPSVDGSDRGVSLKTGLTVSQISARIIFTSNWRRESDAALRRLEASTAIVPLGGIMGTQQTIKPTLAGHDPLMWIQLIDGYAASLASPICLGRASECPSHAEFICPVPITATAWLAARECCKSRGPVLDCAGDLTIVNGISARVLLAVGCDKFGVPIESLGAVDVVILPPGATLHSPPKLVMAGVGGRTCVSLAFINGTGQPMASEIPVGICARPA